MITGSLSTRQEYGQQDDSNDLSYTILQAASISNRKQQPSDLNSVRMTDNAKSSSLRKDFEAKSFNLQSNSKRDNTSTKVKNEHIKNRLFFDD